jgi:NTE family protein
MKAYMGDYRIGLVRRPTLPLARAVAASSAFPPLFAPIVIKDPGKFEAVAGADLNGDPAYTTRLYLADGGVYDNLGLETVWNRCSTVLASDAGSPFSLDSEVKTDAVHKTLRALDVATDQSRGLRKRMLIADYERGDRKGGYWGIETRIAKYAVADALPCRDARVLPLANIRTRLDAFSAQEQGELVNWGYALCDAAVRRHAPQLVSPGAPAPQWPEPAWRLDR